MRTTIKDNNSKYCVTIHFFMNGYTFSYFDNKEEVQPWINAMSDKHGRVTIQDIKEVKI